MAKINKGIEIALRQERQKRQKAEREAWIRKAYANFKSGSPEDAITASTKASWGGGGYSLELFPSGKYRVLWDNQVGNQYDSPGVIVGIPALTDEECEGDESDWYFDNAIDFLDFLIEDLIEELREGDEG
jgi:hypothetical protein